MDWARSRLRFIRIVQADAERANSSNYSGALGGGPHITELNTSWYTEVIEIYSRFPALYQE